MYLSKSTNLRNRKYFEYSPPANIRAYILYVAFSRTRQNCVKIPWGWRFADSALLFSRLYFLLPRIIYESPRNVSVLFLRYMYKLQIVRFMLNQLHAKIATLHVTSLCLGLIVSNTCLYTNKAPLTNYAVYISYTRFSSPTRSINDPSQ